MIHLRKIKLEGFRGARLPVELDLPGHASIAVYGDNGGGKSTITDALEWFYFNKVAHLWREDCKEECLRNTHIPDNQDSLISIEFSNASLNSDKTLNSKFKGKCSNASKDFKDYLEQSQKERLLLRYGNILRFMLLTKADKRTEVLDIIGYERVTSKVTLMDVPRLGTVLKDSASQIDISFDSLTDLENLGEKIITCYSQAMKKTIQISTKDLAKESFEKTNKFLARSNVMTMLKILDKA